MSARESNAWAAFLGKTKWYKEHYDGRARFVTLLRVTGSVVNRVLFGYAERLWVLLRNYAIATFAVFPLLYVLDTAGLSGSTTAGTLVQDSPFLAAIEFSIRNAVAGALQSSIEAVGVTARLIAAAQIVLTAIWASLIASYLFRWSLQR